MSPFRWVFSALGKLLVLETSPTNMADVSGTSPTCAEKGQDSSIGTSLNSPWYIQMQSTHLIVCHSLVFLKSCTHSSIICHRLCQILIPDIFEKCLLFGFMTCRHFLPKTLFCLTFLYFYIWFPRFLFLCFPFYCNLRLLEGFFYLTVAFHMLVWMCYLKVLSLNVTQQ